MVVYRGVSLFVLALGLLLTLADVILRLEHLLLRAHSRARGVVVRLNWCCLLSCVEARNISFGVLCVRRGSPVWLTALVCCVWCCAARGSPARLTALTLLIPIKMRS